MSGSRSLSSSRHAARGFTLQESLVSLLVGGSLLTGGASLLDTLRDNAQTTAVNTLVAHLNVARSEAIKRYARVTLCPSGDGMRCREAAGRNPRWQDGWLVYADANHNDKPEPNEILLVQQAVRSDISIRTSRNEVTYQPLGTAGGSTITFAVCDTQDATSARYVMVNNAGRARVSRTSTGSLRCT